jgi:hypothetical protein
LFEREKENKKKSFSNDSLKRRAEGKENEKKNKRMNRENEGAHNILFIQ